MELSENVVLVVGVGISFIVLVPIALFACAFCRKKAKKDKPVNTDDEKTLFQGTCSVSAESESESSSPPPEIVKPKTKSIRQSSATASGKSLSGSTTVTSGGSAAPKPAPQGTAVVKKQANSFSAKRKQADQVVAMEEGAKPDVRSKKWEPIALVVIAENKEKEEKIRQGLVAAPHDVNYATLNMDDDDEDVFNESKGKDKIYEPLAPSSRSEGAVRSAPVVNRTAKSPGMNVAKSKEDLIREGLVNGPSACETDRDLDEQVMEEIFFRVPAEYMSQKSEEFLSDQSSLHRSNQNEYPLSTNAMTKSTAQEESEFWK